MKIVKILGGLGNQMFQYALYLALEAYYKEEVIKIDTSCFRGYPLHNGYELKNIYGINALEATFMDKLKIAYPYNHYRIWQIFKRILPKRKSMFLESKNEEFSENVFTQKDNCYYDGYWQNERYFNNIRNIILNKMKKRYIIQPNVRIFKYIVLTKRVLAKTRKRQLL